MDYLTFIILVDNYIELNFNQLLANRNIFKLNIYYYYVVYKFTAIIVKYIINYKRNLD